MEIEQIIKIIIFVLILVVVIGGISFLFVGKGGSVFSSIRDIFRFG